VGAAADQLSDLVMVSKLIQAFVAHKKPHMIMTDPPSAVDEDAAVNQLVARLLWTFLTGGAAILLIRLSMVLSEIVEEREWASVAYEIFGTLFFAILGSVFYKAAMIFLRVVLLSRLLHSVVKYGKVSGMVEKELAWMESAILLDVVLSAVPLGILTALELFYFKHTLGYHSQEIWAIVKFSALGIDMISICNLVYFQILGLDSCGKGHDAEGSPINANEENSILNATSSPEPENT